MKVTEIIASRTCKVNLGDYQSFDVFVSMRAEVDTALDDETQAMEELNMKVEKAMSYQLFRSLKARGKKITKEQAAKSYGLSYVHG